VPVTDADIAERDSFAGDHGDRRPDIVAVREPGFDSTVVVSLDDGDLEIGCKDSNSTSSSPRSAPPGSPIGMHEVAEDDQPIGIGSLEQR